MKQSAFFFILMSVFAALCSCASMTPPAEKRAVCNTLKSNVVFSGATGITRESEIQTAEEPLQQANYDKNCEQ